MGRGKETKLKAGSLTILTLPNGEIKSSIGRIRKRFKCKVTEPTENPKTGKGKRNVGHK